MLVKELILKLQSLPEEQQDWTIEVEGYDCINDPVDVVERTWRGVGQGIMIITIEGGDF